MTHACWSTGYITCDDQACEMLMANYSGLLPKVTFTTWGGVFTFSCSCNKNP